MTERLFTPFLDPVDGILCLSANSTTAEVCGLPLRFPLRLDDSTTWREQVHASTHAPASSRFGPYCDNILGMNWRLPSGRIVRIGERVVKTTTGYDWLRFLLHSGDRFGEPIDYVLRLRPDCGSTTHARFDGAQTALRHCISQLLHSGWMHWWDAVDLIVTGNTSHVRVIVHCVPEETPVFARQLESIALSTRTQLTLKPLETPMVDGLPDLVLKATPDRTCDLALELAADSFKCISLCYSGVVHLYLAPGADLPERAHALAQRVAGQLQAQGGDWHSRWLPSTPPCLNESLWLQRLEEAIHHP